MVRAGALVAAAALAAPAAPSAAQLCSGYGSFPNPACPSLGRLACLTVPGCLWNGTSAAGGVCSGGPACTYQVLPGVCNSLLTCRWVPAPAPADATDCRGDGSLWENPVCPLYGEEGCVVSAGCNWRGQNIYGGWCTGGPQCSYAAVTSIGCLLAPGCSWRASNRAPVPAPGNDRLCRGDGMAWQNTRCLLYPKDACIFTPGCNWGGENVYNGWCTGGPQCTYVVSAYGCGTVPGCTWVPSTVPSGP